MSIIDPTSQQTPDPRASATTGDNPQLVRRTLEFMRLVEALAPTELESLTQDVDERLPMVEIAPDHEPPWKNEASFARMGGKRPQLAAGKGWRYRVYLGIYPVATLEAELVEQLRRQGLLVETEDFFEEPQDETAVAMLPVSAEGHPDPSSLVLGMAAWLFGRAQKDASFVDIDSPDAFNPGEATQSDLNARELQAPPSGFPGYDRQLIALKAAFLRAWNSWQAERRQQALPDQAGSEQRFPVDGILLRAFAQTAVQLCGVTALMGKHHVRIWVKCIQEKRTTTPDEETKEKVNEDDDSFLNSNLIPDLNRALAALDANSNDPAALGQPLADYLREPPTRKIDQRKDLGEAHRLLHPSRFPEGCWPSHHPLNFSQQLAVNTLVGTLGDGAGVLGVNGPPGTGKTTLLRDVVAAAVVRRAQFLADLLRRGESPFAGPLANPDRYRQHCRHLHPSLRAGLIVVASNNNGAVENVSLELPREPAIDPQYRGAVPPPYADIATALLNEGGKAGASAERAWGLIAGKLGRWEFRNSFGRTFWWAKNPEAPIGLQYRLQAIAGRTSIAAILKLKEEDFSPARWTELSMPMRPVLTMEKAVAAFNAELAAEAQHRQRVIDYADAREAQAANEQKVAQLEAQAAHLKDRRVEADEAHVAAKSKSEAAIPRTKQAYNEFLAVQSTRPGFLEMLFSWGKAGVRWRQALEPVQQALQRVNAEARELQATTGIAEKVAADAARAHERAATDLERAREILERGNAIQTGFEASASQAVQHLSADADQRERAAPWHFEAWRRSRAAVFAAAMQLLRAFVENNVAVMRPNLGLAADALEKKTPAEARSLGFDSLAFVCPVVSTTFASAASLFGDMGTNSIGWLLLDEAAQATPQGPVGCLLRARRAVVLGDPLQLEPIVKLRARTILSLAQVRRPNLRQLPGEYSAQRLADRVTPYGTMLGDLWVGLPLRVHRRCESPMFDISNTIAYDGAMVQATLYTDALPLPASAWIDVFSADQSGKDHYVPEEGNALKTLLEELRAAGVTSDRLFVLSPFRTVARKLQIRAPRLAGRTGTVHTAQGKEADVVILVLGGRSPGARRWAASKPNLLNVAVSRAKRRLYVIGNRRNWRALPYFEQAAALLPQAPSRLP
jgi:hypothetical protein